MSSSNVTSRRSYTHTMVASGLAGVSVVALLALGYQTYALHRSYGDIAADIGYFSSEVENLRETRDKTQQEVHALREESVSLAAEIAARERALQDMNGELQRAVAERDVVRAQQDDIAADLAEANETIAQAQDAARQRRDAEAKLADLRGLIESQQREQKNLELVMTPLRQERDKIRDEITTLTEDLEQIAQLQRNAQARLDALESEENTLNARLPALREEERSLGNLQAQISLAEMTLQERQADLERLSADITTANTNAAAATTDLAKAQTDLENALLQRERIMAQVAAADVRLASLDADVDAAEARLETARQQADVQNATIVELRNTYAAEVAKRDELAQELARLADQRDNVTLDLNNRRAALAQVALAEEQIDTLGARVAALRQEASQHAQDSEIARIELQRLQEDILRERDALTAAQQATTRAQAELAAAQDAANMQPQPAIDAAAPAVMAVDEIPAVATVPTDGAAQ